MIKKILFLLIISTVFTGCKKDGLSRNQQKKINAALEKLACENDLPGINFSVIINDGKQENFSYGYADLEKKEKLNEKHVLFTGSIGKTFAASMIYKLFSEGRLGLKDKFIEFFPNVEWLKEIPNIEEITIEMLLQHTSGLPRYVMNPGVWDSLATNPNKVWSYHDRLELIVGEPADHAPGKGWAYSDTNYILLGMLIEKLNREPYYDQLVAKILKPYELYETHPAIVRNLYNLACGYSKLDSLFKMPYKTVSDGFYAFNPQLEWTGGGIASTTSDLAKWAKIYYTSELIPEYFRQQIITPNANGRNVFPSTDYGIGSFIFHTKSGTAYGHTGFIPGYVSIFAYYPDLQIAVALQINCDYAKEKLSLQDYLDTLIPIITH